MFAVVCGMHHLVHQGVEHGNRVFKGWADKYLVDARRAGLSGPALPDVARSDTGTGKTAGWVAIGNGIALFFKDRCERHDGVRKPCFAVGLGFGGHSGSEWSVRRNARNCVAIPCDDSDYGRGGVSWGEIVPKSSNGDFPSQPIRYVLPY